jgi:poly-gamma-glutamate capsule biosynthesis protein CapA/YwtB (metallophosphatase superfamily)
MVGLGFGAWEAVNRPPSFSWSPTPTRAFSEGKERVQLVFAGDVSVARSVGESIAQAGHDPVFLLEKMRPLFLDADLVFANLECVLSAATNLTPAPKTFTLRGLPADARALTAGGIDVVSVANNHAMDFGYPGFFDTLRATSELGLLVTGVLQDDGQRLVVVPVGTMNVGFLAYNAHGDEWAHRDWRPRAAPYNLDDVLEDVARARPRVDQLVVSLHWGPELSHLPWDWQKDHAHRLVDAGVDLVVGHHPHVEQVVEEYGAGLIAYSLGDLAFDKKTPWLRSRTGPRFVLAVDFENKRRTAFRLLPIRHEEDFRPLPAPDQDTTSLLVSSARPSPGSAPERPSWRASDHIEEARVTRGDVACDSFAEKRARQKGGWLRWIDRRWRCPSEGRYAGDSVGRTAELSATVLQTGIWASPGDGDVVVRFQDVPVGETLHLTFGFPDWVIVSETKKSKRASARIALRAGGTEFFANDVEVTAGWHTADVSSRALPSGTNELEVVVSGPRLSQPGFVFELEVR